MNLIGKKVLLIGSGSDLSGRKMCDEIDSCDKWDIVVRLNKPYGEKEDVGTRTDMIFSRYWSWDARYFDASYNGVPRVVVNEFYGITEGEVANLRAELYGSNTSLVDVSIGIIASNYFLVRGADVSVIGFGYKGGVFNEEKTYTDGKVDTNQGCNWKAENSWLLDNVTLLP